MYRKADNLHSMCPIESKIDMLSKFGIEFHKLELQAKFARSESVQMRPAASKVVWHLSRLDDDDLGENSALSSACFLFYTKQEGL